jgi:hypothetical protein
MPTVEYDVVIKGGQGAATLDALKAKAKELQQSLHAEWGPQGAINRMAGGGGGGPGGGYMPPGGGGGPGGGGVFGGWGGGWGGWGYGMRPPFNPYGSSLVRILPGVGAGYLALRAGQSAAQFGTQALAAESNPLLSEYQKDRAVKESLPIIGGFVKDWLAFVDELSGLAPRVREMQRRTTLTLAQVAAHTERELGRREDADRLFSAQARAAYGGGGVNAARRAGFLSGLRRPEDIEHLDPLIYREQVSEQNLSVANAEQTRSDNLAGGTINAMQQATRNREIFEQDVANTRERMRVSAINRQRSSANQFLRGVFAIPTYGLSLAGRGQDGGNTAQEQEALDLKQKSLTEAIAKEKAAIAAAEQASKLNNQQINSLYEHQRENLQAIAGISRARLQMAEDEREKSKQGEAAFGLLRPEQRNAAVEAARKLSAFGPTVLSDEELGLVHRAGVFGRLIQTKAIESAEKDRPLLEDALRLGGMRGLPEIALDIDKFKKEVENFGELGPAMQKMTEAWRDAIKRANDDADKFRDAREANRNADAQNKQLQEAAGAGK